MGLFSYGADVQKKVEELVTSIKGTYEEGNYNETTDLVLETLKYVYIGVAYDNFGFIAANDIQREFNNLTEKEKDEMKRSMLLELIMLQ